MTQLTILIADDHPLFRRGLLTLLSSIPDFEVVGEAATGEEVVAKAVTLEPAVILMDLQLPKGNGITATRAILQTHPNIRILVVTLFDDDDSVFAALRAGARGYILKDSDEEEIIRAVRAVGNGEAIFSPSIAAGVLEYFSAARPTIAKEVFPSLTEREREILRLVARGKNNAEVAAQLSLSSKTVSNYLSNIYNKLQVVDRAQAIVRAREAGVS